MKGLIRKWRWLLLPLFVVVAAVLYVWLLSLGRYSFAYVEQGRTFFYDEVLIRSTLMQKGGAAQVVADWLTQFFVVPEVGVFVTALLLTVAMSLVAMTLKRLADKEWLALLAAVPVVAQGVLLYNTNYQYFGLVAYAMFAAALLFVAYCDRWRVVVAVVVALALLYLAGPVSVLFCVVFWVVELLRCARQSLWALVPLVVVIVVAQVSTLAGDGGELRHLVTPEGYFTLRLKAGSVVWLPWTMTLLVVLVACLWRKVGRKLRWGVVLGIVAAEVCASVGFALFAGSKYVAEQTEAVKELSYYSRRGEWARVEQCCREYELRKGGQNLLFHNYRNLALAEQGMLGERLFASPCYDIQSVYLQGDKTPGVAMVLSDIYFSMGHMALSQRYAFEALESLGNRSPRMLQRLAEIAIVTNEPRLASRYLRLLERTTYYSSWAAQHRLLLTDSIALSQHPLSSKRRCLFADNRLSGSLGLDDDLKHIARANPTHTATREYLCSLYLLSKDLTRFGQALDEFYPHEPLPRAFAEGAALLESRDPTLSGRFLIDDDTRARLLRFTQGERDPHTFWYFWKYSR